MSSSLEGLDLHILGYFVDPEHAELIERLTQFRQDRVERARRIVARLQELGAPVEESRVFGRAAGGVVGRPHVAGALVEAGHATDIDDAFRRFLAARAPAYVARPAFHPAEAIRLIHAAGGVSVLAHPGLAVPDLVIELLASEGWRRGGAPTARAGVALPSARNRRLGLPRPGAQRGRGRGVRLGERARPPEGSGRRQRLIAAASRPRDGATGRPVGRRTPDR
jgi:hypothetical protein